MERLGGQAPPSRVEAPCGWGPFPGFFPSPLRSDEQGQASSLTCGSADGRDVCSLGVCQVPPCARRRFGVYLWSASPSASQSPPGSHPLRGRSHCQLLCIQHASGTFCVSPVGAGRHEKGRVPPGPAGMERRSMSRFRATSGPGPPSRRVAVPHTCAVARAFVTSAGSCCHHRPGIQPSVQGTASSREPRGEPQPLAVQGASPAAWSPSRQTDRAWC